MRRFLSILLCTGLALSMGLAANAAIIDLPVKTLGGKNYYYYEVQPKETVYSLCNKLGISKETLIRFNPSVAEGLKAYSTLFFPVEEHTTGEAVPTSSIHVVQKKETIYGISKKYGVTMEQLTLWNPSIREGLKEGQRIIVSPPSTSNGKAKSDQTKTDNDGFMAELAEDNKSNGTYQDNDTADSHSYLGKNTVAISETKTEEPSDDRMPKTYTVRERETFYSIAHAHGLTVEELEKANPGIGILQAGQTLRIPVPVSETKESVARQQLSELENIENEEEAIKDADVSIAVILPFMLSQNDRNRQAQFNLEFYKGFLIAVDSLRNCGTPIKIQTYDTAGSIDTLRNILSKPELKSVQMIIGPDSEMHLAELARFGNENNINILNIFAVKDNTYRINDVMFQANIPHTEMYRKAISGMLDRTSGFTPVILRRKDGPDDKAEYIAALKQRLESENREYKEITFDVALQAADLEILDKNGSYAFIPVSGKQAEANKILPALIELKQSLSGFDPVRVYGYPEWTTFRGETLTNMHTLNTLVYSRFFTVPEDPRATLIEETFVKWFGTPMGNYVPRQGILGFDTGMYLINALRVNKGDFNQFTPVYIGVQNGFDFIHPDGASGWANDDLYFVNFRPSGLIDRIAL